MIRFLLETFLPFAAVIIFSLTIASTDSSLSSWLASRSWSEIREWVSALSGWAAAIAATATMIVILRQIAQSDRHHRENIMFQQLELLNVAKKTKATLKASRVRADPLAQAYGDLDEMTFKQNYQQILNALRDLDEWFSDQSIDEFERRIGTDNPNDLIGLRRQLAYAMEKLEDWLNKNLYLLRRQDIKRISRDVTKYCDLGISTADSFIKKYESQSFVD